MLTIRKKRPEAEATAPDATVAQATTEAPPTPAAESSGLEPGVTATSGGVSAKGFTAFAILGIVATVCVIAVLALQFAEISFYKADPSVWPVK